MTRKEYIQKSLILGMGFPFLSGSLLQSCGRATSTFPKLQTNFSGKIAIVGAGAAGLTAGFLLKRHGVDFEIIEAAPLYGGRIKKVAGFADFPIDIGAEWIHTDPEILTDLINEPNANADVMVYDPQIIKSWKRERLKNCNYIGSFYSEWKFKRSTWFDFFEQFIVPEVADKIVLNTPIEAINYETDKVTLKSTDNTLFEADKALVTIPIKTLQQQQIRFQPNLPNEKTAAINKVFMGDGIKVFIEFKEKFYPDILSFGNIFRALNEEEKFVYDAAFKKGSDKHILALFAINEKAAAYTQLQSEEAIMAKFLGELDAMFEGKATANYIKHVVQNWSNEPYIQGAYSYSFDGNKKSIFQAIQNHVKNKIYFAGEALSIKHQATVHGACESAYHTIANILANA